MPKSRKGIEFNTGDLVEVDPDTYQTEMPLSLDIGLTPGKQYGILKLHLVNDTRLNTFGNVLGMTVLNDKGEQQKYAHEWFRPITK